MKARWQMFCAWLRSEQFDEFIDDVFRPLRPDDRFRRIAGDDEPKPVAPPPES